MIWVILKVYRKYFSRRHVLSLRFFIFAALIGMSNNKDKKMDIKELLDQFTLFDPAKGQRADLPAVEGNYIVVLKAGCNIPDVLGNFKYTEITLHGVDYRVLSNVAYHQ